MMKKILLALLLIPTLSIAQHTITGNLSPADQFSWCILYKVNANDYKYTADTRVEDGKFTLTLDTTVTKGVYKLVYGIPQEERNFDLIYNGEEDIVLTFSIEEGLSFSASEENKVYQQYMTESFFLDQEISNEYAFHNVDAEKIAGLFEQKEQLQKRAEDASQGTYSESFILASRTYIPSTFEPQTSYEEKKRLDYFKYLDPNNPVIQNSGFLLDRFMKYIHTFSLDTEMAASRELDAIITLLQNSDTTFQKNLLYQLWGKLVVNEMPKSANYLTEKYLFQLCTTLGDDKVATQLENYRNTSIGIKVPDFTWEYEENEKVVLQHLHDYHAAQNYILVFWSSTCSHCLKELPKLQRFANTLNPKEYKVIAVGIEDSKYDWKKETSKYPEFQHVLGLGKWDNPIAKAYSITQTPTFLLLDKDKILTAKPSGLTELKATIAPEKAEK